MRQPKLGERFWFRKGGQSGCLTQEHVVSQLPDGEGYLCGVAARGERVVRPGQVAAKLIADPALAATVINWREGEVEPLKPEEQPPAAVAHGVGRYVGDLTCAVNQARAYARDAGHARFGGGASREWFDEVGATLTLCADLLAREKERP